MKKAAEQVELLEFTALKEGRHDSGASDHLSLVETKDELEVEGPSPAPPPESAPGVSSEGGGGKKLQKEVNVLHMVGFIVGEIIGSGIFVSPFIVLNRTGSAGLSLITWAMGGFFAVCGSLCYIELGTLLRKSGGEYTIIRETYTFRELKKPWLEFLGSLMAFLFTWASCFIIRPISIGIITLTFGRYLARPFYIGCDIPPYTVRLLALSAVMLEKPFLCFNQSNWTVLFAMTSYPTAVLITMLQCSSVRWTARVITFLSSVKLLACLLIVMAGAGYLISGSDLSPDLKHPFASSTSNPSNVGLALYAVLWAYNGWNVLNYFIEEQKNVARDLPRATVTGIALVILSYLLVNLAFFAVLSYDQILSAEAVALVYADEIAGKAGVTVICVLVSLSTFGAATGSLFSGVRVMNTAARDGTLPDFLSGVHTTLKTPMPATLFLSLLASIAIAAGDIEGLINSESASVWTFYLLSFVAVLVLRVTRRHEERHFKVWIVVPIFMSVVSVLLIVVPLWQEPWPSLIAFGVMACGIPVYIVLVMEAPRRLRPKVLDTFSGHVSTFTNSLLNTESSR